MQTRRKAMKHDRRALPCCRPPHRRSAPVRPSRRRAKTVRLADQNGSEVDYAAVWVAELNGYYQEEGIKIDRKTYANGPSALLDINNLDAVMAAIVPFMQYVARGGDIRIVMSVTKGNAPIIGKKQYKIGEGPRRQEGRHARHRHHPRRGARLHPAIAWASSTSTCRPRSPTSPS